MVRRGRAQRLASVRRKPQVVAANLPRPRERTVLAGLPSARGATTDFSFPGGEICLVFSSEEGEDLRAMAESQNSYRSRIAELLARAATAPIHDLTPRRIRGAMPCRRICPRE